MARIGDILVSKGVVTQDVLEQAVAIQQGEHPDKRRQLGRIVRFFNLWHRFA